jgi:predicted PurR-regulated permease PerM
MLVGPEKDTDAARQRAGAAPADDRLTRNIKILTLIALSLALAAVAGIFIMRVLPVAVVLIGATFFAYLVYPAVNWLQRRGLARWLAITLIYIVLGTLLGGAFTFLWPVLNAEFHTLSHDFPGIITSVRNGIINAHNNILNSVPLEARNSAVNILDQVLRQIQATIGHASGRALEILLSVASIITGLIIVPILAFYILLDSDRLRETAVAFFPARYRTQTLLVLHDVDVVVGGFIRGQLIVGSVVALMVTILLLVAHIKYAFLIGLFAGVADIIPYVGAVAGAIPAVLIAFLSKGLPFALLIIGGFALIYEIEGHVVAPAVVGQKVGLSPLIVIVALLIGAELGGIGGMFVAVPIAGILRVLWKRLARPPVLLQSPQSPLPPPSPPPAAAAEDAIVIAKQ